MSARTKDRESDYAMSAKRYAEQVVAGEILADYRIKCPTQNISTTVSRNDDAETDTRNHA